MNPDERFINAFLVRPFHLFTEPDIKNQKKREEIVNKDIHLGFLTIFMAKERQNVYMFEPRGPDS